MGQEIDVSIDEWNDWDEKSSKAEEKKQKKTTPSRKGRFTDWEDTIIKEDWQTCTDKQIAEKISRTEDAVIRRRKILGFKKTNGRPGRKTRKKAIFTNPTEYNLSKLSKEDRIEFYKRNFEKNPRYQWLSVTLMDNEIAYYKQKYIEIIDALDSITHQEEDLLHSMIMKEIQIVRLQKQMKDMLQAYEDDEDEEKRPPPQYLYQDLDKAEQQYVKYQEKLKMTREQRLKTDKEEKITITSMVRAFLDAQNRQESGDMAGQMSYYGKKCRQDMDKMNFLIGGAGGSL